MKTRKACVSSAPWHRRAAVAAAVVLFISAAGCSGLKKDPSALLLMHPVPPERGAYAMVAGALRYENGGLTVELRPIDPRYFDRSLTEAGQRNPFGVPPDDARHPLIFGLSVTNAGPGMVYLNPTQVRGLDDRKGRHYPVSFTDLWQMLADNPEREARFKTFSRSFLDTPAQIQPGKSLRILLALTRTKEEPEQITVILPLSLGGKETRTLSFLFEVFEEER